MRIVRLSPEYQVAGYFGQTGTGEKEFLMPVLITAKENRIAVYDSYTKTIQVFDAQYNPVCALGYNPDPDYENYLTQEFFEEITDIALIAREEDNCLYYYILMLSASEEKMSVLRLP